MSSRPRWPSPTRLHKPSTCYRRSLASGGSVRTRISVIGGFGYSDNTCPVCRAGFQINCLNGGGYHGCQSELIRIPLADGTLVATAGERPQDSSPAC